MVLHAEGLQMRSAQALDALIVQIDVRHLDAARQAVGLHGKAVIVAADLDARVGEHGLVAAAMAELHLVGVAAECQTENLVAEADAEDRHAPE